MNTEKICTLNNQSNDDDNIDHSENSKSDNTDSISYISRTRESLFQSSICFNKSILILLQCEENEKQMNINNVNQAHNFESIQDQSTIEEINVHEMKDIINNNYILDARRYVIIDVRYPYEYQGGHIRGAINLFTPLMVFDYLFNLNMIEKEKMEITLQNAIYKIMNTVQIESKIGLIFHCEFSSVRGPKMAEELRDIDRLANLKLYPKLIFPKIYILKRGYSEFYFHYKTLCEPEGYVKMDRDDQQDNLMDIDNGGDVVMLSDKIRECAIIRQQQINNFNVVFYRREVDKQLSILSNIKKKIASDKKY